MNKNVFQYYQESSGEDSVSGHFHKVIALHESPGSDWEMMLELAPTLPRGWYELSRLSSAYRIEFVRDYWMAKLPYHPQFVEFLQLFFENLDEVGIYLTQQVYGDPFEVQMVYSLKGDSSFFHGSPPCTEEVLKQLNVSPEIVLPEDYLAFLQIHDGFSKYTDTGLIKVKNFTEVGQAFQFFLSEKEALLTTTHEPIDPKRLIPFYESFGLHCYQCFFADWYPQQEMGNVYYSGIEHSLSDIGTRSLWAENLAFPTFLDWLLFYLKGVDEV